MNSRRSQITLQPGVLRWARERAGFSSGDLAKKLGVKLERVLEWEHSGRISIAQTDALAKRTYTPLGFLYLSAPPDESLPIADFRTLGNEPVERPSPSLIETVYAMQRRQDWMRDELITEYEASTLSFVGKFTSTEDPRIVAASMRETLALKTGWAAENPNWESAMRFLQERIESIGILLVINGVVGNNAHRKLDPGEFQGFVLSDEYAPLIFVNNADYKSAQMFTIAHELAHIFIGETGLSNFEYLQPSDHAIEQFCNQTAAEFLVPEKSLRNYWPEVSHMTDPYAQVARQFKVSSIVVARRTLDLRLISRETFFKFYSEYQGHEWRISQQSQEGGSFWNTQRWRIGTRFATTVARAVREERLTYREAYSLTGLKGDTFEKMQEMMGIEI